MPVKKHKPEEIIGKRHEAEIVLGRDRTTAKAFQQIDASEVSITVAFLMTF